MSMLIPSIAFASTTILGGVLTQIRARYLKRASMAIKIDKSYHAELRTAGWAYAGLVLPLALGLFVGIAGMHEKRGLMYFTTLISLALIAGAAFLWHRLRISHVVISEGKLCYEEGADKVQISFGDVTSVSLRWFTFDVKLGSGVIVSIPANYQSTEVIWAFLREAALKPRLQ
jgi:hypothetical protein